jgi:hypothetical protein
MPTNDVPVDDVLRLRSFGHHLLIRFMTGAFG